MAPPIQGPSPASQNVTPVDPAQERRALLVESALVGDPRWQDFNFRKNHLKLFFALEALQGFMNGSVSEEKLRQKMEAWIQAGEAASPEDKTFYNSVQKNLYAQLSHFQAPENSARAEKVKELLPAGAPPPPAEPIVEPAEPQTPVASPAPPPPVEQDPQKDFYERGWRLNSLNFDFHVADEKFRGLPSIYTLGVIPKEGITQFQSSDFGWVASSEFGYRDFNFLAGFYHEDMTPNESPAHYNRLGLRLGLVEYGNSLTGDRGPGGGFHAQFFGRKRIALELGMASCAKIDYSEVSGAKCPEGSFQLGVFNNSTFFSTGYGPFEAGVNLLPSKFYLQKDALRLPGINRLPIEFSAAWNFNELQSRPTPQKPEDVLRSEVSDAEVTMTAMDLLSTTVASNYRRKQEAAFQETRLLFFGDQGQFALTNAGSFIFGMLTGWGEGTLAHRLSRDLRYGNGGQRAALLGLMGAELGLNLYGVLSTPGTPDQVEVFRGSPVPPDADLSGNEGITNLQARAWRLNAPQIVVRDVMAGLGAVGAFGDDNKAIEGESLHYPIAHGALAAGGVVLILTSGNGSGDGFFGNSIMGNQPPQGENIEIKDSDYDLGAQSWQYHRLEGGTQGLAYGANGLIHYLSGRLLYLALQKKQGRGPVPEGGSHNQEAAAAHPRILGVVDPRINIQLNREKAVFSIQGRF